MTADSVGLGDSEPAVAGWILVIDDDAIARDLIADNLKASRLLCRDRRGRIGGITACQGIASDLRSRSTS